MTDPPDVEPEPTPEQVPPELVERALFVLEMLARSDPSAHAFRFTGPDQAEPFVCVIATSEHGVRKLSATYDEIVSAPPKRAKPRLVVAPAHALRNLRPPPKGPRS